MKFSYKKNLKNFELDVNLEIPDTGITVLFGPSGSGKSSLLNLLAGLDNDASKVKESYFSLNNHVYDDKRNKIKLKTWHRNIGYVFQDHRLFPNMSVEKNIYFGYKRRGSEINDKDIIKKFKIEQLLTQYPEQLSGGEKQRVAMVRALLSRPAILILDEPLASLDYMSRQELLPYIECIHKELTIPVIYVSHDIKEVLRLADYIVVLDKGKVVDQGDIARLCVSEPLMTQEEGASFILQGKVTRVYEEDSLVEVNTGNEKIFLTAENMSLEQTVRILIHAKEVSLCLEPPENSSILNCVPVTIEEIIESREGELRVVANLDGQTLVSKISCRSACNLKLEQGKEVYAQFKATGMIK